MINLNPKYQILFKSNTRYTVITGGRGSSKSFSVGTFLSLLSFESDEKILFTRKTMTSAHLSVIPEFKDKIERLKKEDLFEVNKTEITNKLSGSQILFRGLQSSSGDNTANLKSLQGVTCWVLDEAEELTDEDVFNRIDLSVRHLTKQNRVILILNPTTKESWLYKRFFEQAGVNPGFNGIKGNVTYIHTDYRDNIQYLPADFVDQIETLKETNPQKYKHVILGGWLDKAEGVVYTNWEIGDFVDNGNAVYGQDFGFSVDPTTLVKVCIDKSRKVIYVHECFYKPKLTTSEIFELNNRYAGQSLIYGDSAEPRLIEELRRRGNNIKAVEKGAGSVSASIALLQDYKLVISPTSVNTIKELNNYVWNDKASKTPVDAWNHSLDALSYATRKELKSNTTNNLQQIASIL